MVKSCNPQAPKEENTVKSRLLRLLKAKHISQAEFSRRLGVSPAYIAAMRKSISPQKLHAISEIFPDLNLGWLMYGDGEMLTADNDNTPDLSKGYVVPLLPVEAFAGSLQMWSDGVALSDCEKVVSPVPGADFAIRIAGDSMEPVFRTGTILFIKKINEQAFIPWGNPMVIDTENGVLVKLLYPVENQPLYDDEAEVEARSYNRDYPPFRIPVSSIYGVYRILTSIVQYSTI